VERLSGAGPDKHPNAIAGMFDAIARRYDLLNHRLSAGLDRRWRARAVRELALDGHEVVLDLCTGTADLAMAAVRGEPGRARRVLGVDFAGEMLRIGQRKLRTAACDDRVPLVRGDAMRLPIASHSVDCAMVAFGIRNVVDPAVACAEVRRVLRPGGRFAVLEFAMPQAPGVRRIYAWYFRHVLPRIGRAISRHDAAYEYLPASVGTFFPPEAFKALVERAGFSRVRAVPLSLGIVYLYMAETPGARVEERAVRAEPGRGGRAATMM
jgi:demethylmenaquinone methyltransferase/2-methoxy-6-polyprenyl-1,4-benzoquinol methylase